MHRFYLPAKKCGETTFFLTDREAHHAAQVLRVKTGEKISVLDGEGNEF
ncbi:MAG: RNA methyltransferase PUA domain-containing protein, partial [Verrucomicrobiota bacterium]